MGVVPLKRTDLLSSMFIFLCSHHSSQCSFSTDEQESDASLVKVNARRGGPFLHGGDDGVVVWEALPRKPSFRGTNKWKWDGVGPLRARVQKAVNGKTPLELSSNEEVQDAGISRQ